MAAKLLHSLADDNPDLQKQIGCMNGIFQLFDKHNALTTRRLVHTRLPAGDSRGDGSLEKDSNSVCDQPIANEITRSSSEKQKISTESSRASLSSSCSSLSSLDLCKSVQPEVSSSDRVVFPEFSSRDPVLNQGSTSPHLGRHSLDMRDVVKESMYRETRGLSFRANTREKALTRVVKHQDSPRPLQLSKPVGGSSNSGKKTRQNVPQDLKESPEILVKHREVPWYSEELRELSTSYDAKNGQSLFTSKDAPRFSYDGRERNRLSFESRETIKSSAKLKDLPRLSLDSRERSMRNASMDSKNSQSSSNYEAPISQQISGSQKRPPSVVAKLMGLETFPDCSLGSNSQSDSIKSSLAEENGPFLKPLLMKDPRRPTLFSNLPRNSRKDPTSPRRKSTDVVMKPISSSRVPIEPAPWRQPDRDRVSKTAASRLSKSLARTAEHVPTVYSEIEKRLKDLEFKQSGKDLRALKQIIEAIQAKGVSETQKEEGLNQSLTSMCQINNQSSRVDNYTTSKSERTFESPIVIMKPTKLAGKSSIPSYPETSNDGTSGVRKYQRDRNGDSKWGSVKCRSKDPTPKMSHKEFASSSLDKKASCRNAKSTQSSTRSQSPSKVNTTGTVSPKLQQKKLELEKRSRPPVPPLTSLNKTRRQSSGQPKDSGVPGGISRIQSPNLQKSDEQLSDLCSDTRSSRFHADMSLPSDSNVFLDAHIDLEVPSVEQSVDSSSSQSPSSQAFQEPVIDSMNKKVTERLSDNVSVDYPAAGPVHTSPVSVLDETVYQDDSPSSVNQTPESIKDDGSLDTNIRKSENQWNSDERFSSENMQSGFATAINRQKLQNVEHLVQKLSQLNSNHDEASTDYIASLCETTNPDDRYISEILLASGLLLRDLGSDLTSFQIYPSGDAINPELFLVLEQTKGNSYLFKEESSPEKISQSKKEAEKIHRKLMFDAVNELITKKLSLVNSSAVSKLRPNKLAKKALSARMLLAELCLEIEQLQADKLASSIEEEMDDLKCILCDDVMQRSESWADFSGEISGIVLDIERRIFKDLVDEIVIGGSAKLRTKRLWRRQPVK